MGLGLIKSLPSREGERKLNCGSMGPGKFVKILCGGLCFNAFTCQESGLWTPIRRAQRQQVHCPGLPPSRDRRQEQKPRPQNQSKSFEDLRYDLHLNGPKFGLLFSHFSARLSSRTGPSPTPSIVRRLFVETINNW